MSEPHCYHVKRDPRCEEPSAKGSAMESVAEAQRSLDVYASFFLFGSAERACNICCRCDHIEIQHVRPAPIKVPRKMWRRVLWAIRHKPGTAKPAPDPNPPCTGGAKKAVESLLKSESGR